MFYSQTFDFEDLGSPEGWSLPDGWSQNDYNNLGHRWVWRSGTDSIRGFYTFEKGHRYSESPDDGFWVFPIDEYNYRDGLVTVHNADVDFQMAPIDCSQRPSVIFRMNQHFRHCCQGSTVLSMYVSNTYGIHWAEYNLRFGSRVNGNCPRNSVEVDISEVAAGMEDVRIKFVFRRSRLYFWAMDDITLSEGYSNELQIEDTWQYFNDNDQYIDDGFIYMVPVSQLGINGFGRYYFKAALQNMGINQAKAAYVKADILKNGIPVYSEVSLKRDIEPSGRDTFFIDVPFLPDEIGDYKMTLSAGMEQKDDIPANNIFEDTFYVTDSVYSICDWDPEDHASTADLGNNDGDHLGVVYDISSVVEANSISAFITSNKGKAGAGTRPGMDFRFWLWRMDEETESFNAIISSDFTEVDEEMLDSWVSLSFQKDGESEFLSPGIYIASIQTWHGGGSGADSNRHRFTVGSDNSHNYNPFVAFFKLNNDTGWSWLKMLPMIRLNINNQSGPSSVPLNFNVDMTLPIAEGIFVPGTDFVDVAGTINGWAGSDHMTDDDGDGIYTLAVEGIVPFSVIEYKYRINGNWDTSEFPSGGPNRVYRTSYWNNLDDVYNDGLSTVGIETIDIERYITIYPNPNNGVFTLSISNPSGEDLDFVLTNIQGQVLLQEKFGNITSHLQQIDLSSYSKGLYFLKVGEQVHKILVK